MDNLIENLIELNKEIEECFIILADLESNGLNNSSDYEYCFERLKMLVEKEKILIIRLGSDSKEVMSFLKNTNPYKREPIIALGYVESAFYFRLLNLFHGFDMDDLKDYASTLKSDINILLLKLIESMIDNEYFSGIKEELIYYKYNLMFLNMDSEEDFLSKKDLNSITLKANNYRTKELSYGYVDDSVLGLDSMLALSFLYSIDDDFKNSSDTYAKVVISILNILTRLTLSENDLVSRIYPEINYLLSEDNPNTNLKETIMEMVAILKELENNIKWGR